jgi:hypothetical protein
MGVLPYWRSVGATDCWSQFAGPDLRIQCRSVFDVPEMPQEAGIEQDRSSRT